MLRCKPEPLDPQLKVVVHVPQYDSIKDAILADKTKNGGSTAIVALGASGGVGTTWMARRLKRLSISSQRESYASRSVKTPDVNDQLAKVDSDFAPSR